MEAEFLHWLRHRLPAAADLPLGLGDDAALLPWRGRNDIVVTTDVVTDQVDFLLSKISPRRAGRKALAVSLSDIAAMAARPVAAFVSLVLPREGGMSLAQELYEGMIPLAERYGVTIAGGDTNSWDGPLVIGTTVIGEVTSQGPLRRGGARPTDRIVVTGVFGGSLLGHHLDFEPRVVEARLLHECYTLHAGMDVSDGLLLDLSRLAKESGCGACVDLSAVPIAPAAIERARQLAGGSTPLDHALGDGEDFELLLAVPHDVATHMVKEQPLNVPLTCIGEFVATPGLWTRDENGRLQPLQPRGFQHEFGP